MVEGCVWKRGGRWIKDGEGKVEVRKNGCTRRWPANGGCGVGGWRRKGVGDVTAR
ncbi:hypothetical protein Hanom_Chr00s074702g01790551 [Helianthus anomalus]